MSQRFKPPLAFSSATAPGRAHRVFGEPSRGSNPPQSSSTLRTFAPPLRQTGDFTLASDHHDWRGGQSQSQSQSQSEQPRGKVRSRTESQSTRPPSTTVGQAATARPAPTSDLWDSAESVSDDDPFSTTPPPPPLPRPPVRSQSRSVVNRSSQPTRPTPPPGGGNHALAVVADHIPQSLVAVFKHKNFNRMQTEASQPLLSFPLSLSPPFALDTPFQRHLSPHVTSSLI
jgi:hypothetical protein